MPADPYTILGVSKSASADDIKKAYRKLAHKHHPDKKGGDESKFKEINEAYQTLSDPDKKARFDQFGHTGSNGGFGGGQGQYQDFDFSGMGGFESIFDMFGGMGGTQTRRPEKGEDLYLEVQVTKKDFGHSKVYEFEAFSACEACAGTGAENGKLIQCTQCQGQGQVRQSVRTPFGTFAQAVVCSKCSGVGQVAEHKCKICNGHGRSKTRRTLELHIPDAINDRYLIVFPRQGNAGPEGVPAGDLMITMRVK